MNNRFGWYGSFRRIGKKKFINHNFLPDRSGGLYVVPDLSDYELITEPINLVQKALLQTVKICLSEPFYFLSEMKK